MNEERAPSSSASGLSEPVAIVGMACLFPKAGDLESYWANIRDGVDAIVDIPPSRWSIND